MTTKIKEKNRAEGRVAKRMFERGRFTQRTFGQHKVQHLGAFVRIVNPVTGKIIRIPKRALNQLSAVLQQLEKGNDVQVISAEKKLTTQEAADILNVSRPFVVKLIKEGKIRHEMVGKHRRLLLKDVIALKDRMKSQQLEGLRQLAAEAQELGLGY